MAAVEVPELTEKMKELSTEVKVVDLSAAQGDRDIGLRPNVSHMGVSNNRGTRKPY